MSQISSRIAAKFLSHTASDDPGVQQLAKLMSNYTDSGEFLRACGQAFLDMIQVDPNDPDLDESDRQQVTEMLAFYDRVANEVMQIEEKYI